MKDQASDAQLRYLTAITAAFRKASARAAQAAQHDPRWAKLAATAAAEATDFQEVLDGSTAGVDLADQQTLITAMNHTQTNRPLFIAECKVALAAARKYQ